PASMDELAELLCEATAVRPSPSLAPLPIDAPEPGGTAPLPLMRRRPGLAPAPAPGQLPRAVVELNPTPPPRLPARRGPWVTAVVLGALLATAAAAYVGVRLWTGQSGSEPPGATPPSA